jgi:hypothetical protein
MSPLPCLAPHRTYHDASPSQPSFPWNHSPWIPLLLNPIASRTHSNHYLYPSLTTDGPDITPTSLRRLPQFWTPMLPQVVVRPALPLTSESCAVVSPQLPRVLHHLHNHTPIPFHLKIRVILPSDVCIYLHLHSTFSGYHL